MMPLLILVTVLTTSILSGVVGMAGGMILMAVLTLLLPVPTAMLLHGVTQTGANGSRAWFLRRHLRWRVLPPYAAGALLCLSLFAWLTLIPDPALVLILIGLFPWIGRILPAIERLDVRRAPAGFACGVIVTSAQLLAGASGPLLDVFFLRSRLSRQEIVATKAITQTLGHLTKLAYYGGVLLLAGPSLPQALGDATAPSADGAPPWLFLTVVPVALLGTRLGVRILHQLDEARFRRLSGRVILAIGAACTMSGIVELAGR
ncbi:MAG: sulfite exporter TauE/SafE family protein [Pseudomonadales bacterium]|jgi:uncharacterized membrane protein YfcA|nr:sulfite exporter TauE/SafE family protein [Pseudomonadales bacterium]